MNELFLRLFNLSIAASWLILAVILLRLILKRAPKWINGALWVLVGIRLLCPFSFESALSLIPSIETIPYDIAMKANPAIDSGIPVVNHVINPVIADHIKPDALTGVNPLQIAIPVASVVWIAGMVALLIYAFVSTIKLKKSVCASVVMRDNILACDEVKSPFVLGIFRPMIYVPSSMSGEMLEYVIDHEKAHIKRCDHWWKPLGYLLLTVYWFNPLCWIAYILLCRDIEIACDEKVIARMNNNDRATYSQVLLNSSYPCKKISACPLAFGEVGVKERVKSVLNYKRPAFWITIVAVVVCIAVAVCFLTSPKTINEEESIEGSEEAPVAHVISDDEYAISILNVFDYRDHYEIKVRLENKSDKKYLYYSTEGVNLDGIYVERFLSWKIGQNQTEDVTIELMKEEIGLEEYGFADVTDVELLFTIKDLYGYKDTPVVNSILHYYPKGKENASVYVREPKDTDIILFDSGLAKVICTGKTMGEDLFCLNVFVEAKSDENLFLDMVNTKLNGEKIMPYRFRGVVQAGATQYRPMIWSLDDFKEYGIEDFKSLEFELRISYEKDPYLTIERQNVKIG